MKLDITLKGSGDSCGPDPEEVFREQVLAKLERIAVALEVGPHVPYTMSLRVGAPTTETPQ